MSGCDAVQPLLRRWCMIGRSVRCILTLFVLIAVLSAVAAPAETATAAEQIDTLWHQRKDAALVDQTIALAIAALQAAPNDYELLWRLARAYYWKADHDSDQSVERADAQQAMRYGEMAIHTAPDRVEGYTYYGLAVGDYGSTVGIGTAVLEGVGPKFERAMLRAYAIDPDFDDGSPALSLGRYYYELPWPKRDLAKSRRFLEELTTRHPGELEGRLYLADTYKALGDTAAARRQLQYVLDHADPPGSGSRHDMRQKAERRMEELNH